MPQLNFLWEDPARPATQEFIGVTYADIDGVRKPRNPDGTDLVLNITGYMEGIRGSRLLLPAGRETGKLVRSSKSKTRLTGMVCDSYNAPPNDVVAPPPSG